MTEKDTRKRNTASQTRPARGGPLGNTRGSASRAKLGDDKIQKYYLQSVARELAPHRGVRFCLRSTIPKIRAVDVWYSGERKTAYYRGLQRCGLVWVCPLCASAITEKRNAELSALLAATEKIPYFVGDTLSGWIDAPRWHLGMATFTVGHKRGVSLDGVCATLDSAYKRCWGGRWAVALKQRYHVIGTIRGFEVTYGAHGWHPHIHTLLVRDSANTPENTLDIFAHLQSRWIDTVRGVGGMVDETHGVDYEAADESALRYIAKLGFDVLGKDTRWSAVSELVKYPVKSGRRGSRTVWDLLRDYAAGDVRAGELWIEAQRALKGRRHLVASGGLYERLGAYVNKETDAYLAHDAVSDTDVLLASLSLADWSKIVASNLRGHIMAVASRGERQVLIDYLESIL